MVETIGTKKVKLCFRDRELDVSFINLLPSYLCNELVDTVNLYEVNTYVDTQKFMDIWEDFSNYIWTSPKSKWDRPTKFFKDRENKFIVEKPAEVVFTGFEKDDKANEEPKTLDLEELSYKPLITEESSRKRNKDRK